MEPGPLRDGRIIRLSRDPTPDQRTAPALDTHTLSTPSGYAGQGLPSDLVEYHPHSATQRDSVTAMRHAGRWKENGGSFDQNSPDFPADRPGPGQTTTHSMCEDDDLTPTACGGGPIIERIRVSRHNHTVAHPTNLLHEHRPSTELKPSTPGRQRNCPVHMGNCETAPEGEGEGTRDHATSAQGTCL